MQDTGKGVDTPTLLTKKQYSKGVFSAGVRQKSDKGERLRKNRNGTKVVQNIFSSPMLLPHQHYNSFLGLKGFPNHFPYNGYLYIPLSPYRILVIK